MLEILVFVSLLSLFFIFVTFFISQSSHILHSHDALYFSRWNEKIKIEMDDEIVLTMKRRKEGTKIAGGQIGKWEMKREEEWTENGMNKVKQTNRDEPAWLLSLFPFSLLYHFIVISKFTFFASFISASKLSARGERCDRKSCHYLNILPSTDALCFQFQMYSAKWR